MAGDEVVKTIYQAVDETSGVLGKIGGGVDTLADKSQKSGKGINNFFKNAFEFATGGVILGALQEVGSQIGNIAKAMISGNAEFERYETQFGVLLGSAGAAKKRLEELAEFGAKTPFELPEVVRADKILQAFGLHAADAGKRFGMSGEQIRTVAGDVAAGTGASFEEISTYLGKFSSGATGEAIARFQELGIVTRQQLSDMGLKFSKSGELLSPLDESMTVLLKAMKGKFGGMMDAQSQTFEGMMSNLKDWGGQALRVIGAPLFDAMKEGLGTLLNFLGSDAVKTGLNTFAQTLASGIQGVMGFVTNLAQGFALIFGGGYQADTGVFTVIQTLAKALGFTNQEATAFGKQAILVFHDIQAAVGTVVAWFTANWPKAQAAATTAFTAIGQAIETYAVPVFNALVEAATYVGNAIAERWPKIQEIASAVFSGVSNVVNTVVLPALGFLFDIVKGVANWWITNWPLISPIIQKVADTIGNLVDRYLANFENSVNTVLPAIQKVFETVFPIVQAVVKTAFEAIGTIVTGVLKIINGDIDGGLNDIKTLFVNAWNGIKTFFEELAPKLVATGTNIINGLYDGMVAAGAKIKDFLIGLIKDALGKFADFLDINSPSKLMYWYGNMTVLGFADGIQDSQHMVQKQMAALGQIVNAEAAKIATTPRAIVAGAGSAVTGNGRMLGVNMLPDGGYTTPTTTGSVAADLDAHERRQQGGAAGAVVIEVDGERLGQVVLGGGRGAGSIFREAARAGV